MDSNNYDISEHETKFSTKTLLIGMILLCFSATSTIFEKLNFHYIHESSLCMILGMIASFIINFGNSTNIDKSSSNISFDEEIFFNLILPPIIFAAGYNLRKRAFFKYISYTFLFGIIGTFTSFFIIAFSLLYFNNNLYFRLPDKANIESTTNYINYSSAYIFMFSAIISATDSVVPLTFIKEKDSQKLFSILFGEGVLNDAVCIVLYRIIKSINNNNKNDSNNLINIEVITTILIKFVYLGTISFLLGAIGGFLCALFLKHLKKFKPNRTQENSIVVLFAFITYSVAETLDLSSVISLLFCGIFMSQYALLNLSFQSREESCVVAKIISNFAESFVFCYLGLSITNLEYSYISIPFVIITIILIIISRFFVIYFYSFLIRLFTCNRMHCLRNDMFLMSLSGLIRGAISYGLALTLTCDKSNSNNCKEYKTLVNSSLIIVFFTTFVLGGLFGKIISKIKKYQNEINHSENLLDKDNNSNNLANELCENYSFERFERIEDNLSINNDSKKDSINCNNPKVIEYRKANNDSFIRSDDDKNDYRDIANANIFDSKSQRSCLSKFWSNIDDKYIKPFFIDDWPNVKFEHIVITNNIIRFFDKNNIKVLKKKELESLNI